MLQWLPDSPDEIVFNDRDGERFVARILNVRTGAERRLSRPVYAVSPNGRDAISLSFSRLFDVRPGYGYAGVPDPWADELAPREDGLWHVDLTTGDSRRIFSLADAINLHSDRQPGADTGKHRFNHVQFNTDGSRFAVLHRWTVEGRRVGWKTRLLTLAPDGRDPRVLSDHGMVSHYDWRTPDQLLAWANRDGIGNRYYLFDDGSPPEKEAVAVVGENVLTQDGHCSFAPRDRDWFLTDTYPDRDGFCSLLLFHIPTGRRVDLGRFFGPRPADVEIRCDLHPRWSRDGAQVCVDSIHQNGARQMYVLDVAEAMMGRNRSHAV
jgi:hypothetical protein